MNQIELMKILQKLSQEHRKKIFLLKEIAAYSGLSRPQVAMSLLRGLKKEILWRVKNHWINRLDPPTLEELALTLVSPSYISFESALYHHHVLSQSPRGGLTLATTSRPRRIDTPLGRIEAIHLKSDLFWGYDAHRMALPEKAWLDLHYIRSRKGLQFPEVFYLDQLDQKKIKSFLKNYDGFSSKKLKERLKE